MAKIKNRIGETNINNFGSKMVIVDYNKANDIMVNFVEYDMVVRASYDKFLKGSVKSPYCKSVYGVGYLGIGDYKSWMNDKKTKQYITWSSMIERCYSEKYLNRNQSYRNCTVCEEWLNFQNFAAWFDENYYEIEGEKMNLDKDIIVKRNKIYSPETCVYVPQRINSLIVKSDSSRGNLPIGVNKNDKKYQAECSYNNEKIKIGRYDTPREAFLAYKSYKEKLIKQVAEDYKDKIPKSLYQSMISLVVKIDD